jgi:hypothetical protein
VNRWQRALKGQFADALRGLEAYRLARELETLLLEARAISVPNATPPSKKIIHE